MLTVYPKLGKLHKSDLETGELTKLLKGLKTNLSEKSLKHYTTPKIELSMKIQKQELEKKQEK